MASGLKPPYNSRGASLLGVGVRACVCVSTMYHFRWNVPNRKVPQPDPGESVDNKSVTQPVPVESAVDKSAMQPVPGKAPDKKTGSCKKCFDLPEFRSSYHPSFDISCDQQLGTVLNFEGNTWFHSRKGRKPRDPETGEVLPFPAGYNEWQCSVKGCPANLASHGEYGVFARHPLDHRHDKKSQAKNTWCGFM